MPELWEKHDWETNTSYDRFFRYYLPQTPPRSLDAAYRIWKGYKNDKGNREGVATLSWRQWFQGKNRRGDLIPGSIGWAVRAEAWDEHNRHIQLEQVEKERELRQKNLRDLTTGFLNKVAALLIRFDPEKVDPADIKLGELTNAIRVVTQEIRAVYDLNNPYLFRHELEIKDWRTELLELIREGAVPFNIVQDELGDELARELFVSAGMETDPAIPDQETGGT